MFLLLRKSVIQIKIVDPKLVRHHHIPVIRDTFRDPVMSADGLKPPDLVDILKGDPVHLISSVFLQETSETDHTLAGAADIRESDINKVLLTDPAGNLLFSVFRRLKFHERICAEDTGV